MLKYDHQTRHGSRPSLVKSTCTDHEYPWELDDGTPQTYQPLTKSEHNHTWLPEDRPLPVYHVDCVTQDIHTYETGKWEKKHHESTSTITLVSIFKSNHRLTHCISDQLRKCPSLLRAFRIDSQSPGKQEIRKIVRSDFRIGPYH